MFKNKFFCVLLGICSMFIVYSCDITYAEGYTSDIYYSTAVEVSPSYDATVIFRFGTQYYYRGEVLYYFYRGYYYYPYYYNNYYYFRRYHTPLTYGYRPRFYYRRGDIGIHRDRYTPPRRNGYRGQINRGNDNAQRRNYTPSRETRPNMIPRVNSRPRTVNTPRQSTRSYSPSVIQRSAPAPNRSHGGGFSRGGNRR